MKILRRAAIFLAILAGASMARATSFVMVSDQDLADQASLVVEASVAGRETGVGVRPATEYTVDVERVVKGYAPASRLVIRVPGGRMANGLALRLWGAPELAPGERTLLFLERQTDGAYGILHLMLGAFHVTGAGDRAAAARDLSEALEVHLDGAPSSQPERPRHLERFAAWLADRAAGAARAPDYWLSAAAGPRPAAEGFATLAAGDGFPIRWFAFDGGGRVSWKVHSAGQPGLGPDASAAAFQAALAAWNADPTSRIDYEYAGFTPATGGLLGPDGVNAILFDDPGNAHVPGAFSCAKGGVLAMSGPYYSQDLRLYRGRSYHEAFEADVVTNDGTECFYRGNPTGAAEVFAHELGHTLGLAHSADSGALMWPQTHDDGRGAHLALDDRVAVNAVYGDGTLASAPPPPAGGGGFGLTAGGLTRTGVDLAWTGAPGTVVSFAVESQQGKAFRTLMTLPASAHGAAVHGLARNRSYRFRVRACRGKTCVATNTVDVRTPR